MLWKIALPSSIAPLDENKTIRPAADRKHLFFSLHNCVKIIFDQNHISCFFTDICARLSHRNTDVCSFQSNGIIDTVTCHSNDMTLGLQSLSQDFREGRVRIDDLL